MKLHPAVQAEVDRITEMQETDDIEVFGDASGNEALVLVRVSWPMDAYDLYSVSNNLTGRRVFVSHDVADNWRKVREVPWAHGIGDSNAEMSGSPALVS